jgi:hypothetical protein
MRPPGADATKTKPLRLGPEGQWRFAAQTGAFSPCHKTPLAQPAENTHTMVPLVPLSCSRKIKVKTVNYEVRIK